MNSTVFSQVPETIMAPVSFDSIPLMLSPLSADNSSDCKKPRKNRSAYTLFALEIKPKIKASTNAKLSCVDLQTKVSQLWKALSPEERQKYQEQANEEKLHYMLKLKKFYENATPEALEEATKPKPKRPYSAYCYFVKEVRQAVKLPEAKFKMQDILKHASEKWRLLTEEQKAVYHERAKQAKEAYVSETTDFNESVESGRPEKVPGAAKLLKKGKKNNIKDVVQDASLNKKSGMYFSKDIQEKMERFGQENPKKKVKCDLKEEDIQVKIDSYGSPETAQSGTMKYSGRLFGTPLSVDDNEALKFDIKQEKIEEKMVFPQMPIQAYPAVQYWPAYTMRQQMEPYGYTAAAPQFWNMKAQMAGGVNSNLMSFMMGYEQMRRQMVHQMMMMNQISETASQDSYSSTDAKIEVKSENF